MEVTRTIVFSQRLFFNDSRVKFLCFSEALGVVFPDMCCLGSRFKHGVIFQGHLWDPDWHQEIKAPAASGSKCGLDPH